MSAAPVPLLCRGPQQHQRRHQPHQQHSQQRPGCLANLRCGAGPGPERGVARLVAVIPPCLRHGSQRRGSSSSGSRWRTAAAGARRSSSSQWQRSKWHCWAAPGPAACSPRGSGAHQAPRGRPPAAPHHHASGSCARGVFFPYRAQPAIGSCCRGGGLVAARRGGPPGAAAGAAPRRAVERASSACVTIELHSSHSGMASLVGGFGVTEHSLMEQTHEGTIIRGTPAQRRQQPGSLCARQLHRQFFSQPVCPQSFAEGPASGWNTFYRKRDERGACPGLQAGVRPHLHAWTIT